jgi:hypothetical protein
MIFGGVCGLYYFNCKSSKLLVTQVNSTKFSILCAGRDGLARMVRLLMVTKGESNYGFQVLKKAVKSAIQTYHEYHW